MALVLLGPAALATPATLQWSVLRNGPVAGHPDPLGLLELQLSLPADLALPATGWSLYLSTVSGLRTGPTEGGLLVEPVKGTHYRVRPIQPQPVAAGQTLTLRLLAAEPMHRVDKGPRGAYLVLDAEPDRAWPLATTARALVPGPGDPQPPTAAELYARYQRPAPADATALPPVFPPPLHWQAGAGELRWRARPALQAAPALRAQADQLNRWLGARWPGPVDASQPPLRLRVGAVPGNASPEAYRLQIHPQRGITLTGRSPAGVARGLSSLRDLWPAPGAAWPALDITDAPRFAVRGLLVDIARNFQSPDTLSHTLALMARLKLNTLHLHLSDDEGWRLEIPGLPELTDFGARRGHSADPWRHLPPAHGSGADVADPHGSGHLSRADYIALLREAAALQITVLPEIEMPGHARAAVWAMAARERALAAQGRPDAAQYRLRDPDDPSVYRSAQLHTDHVIDPGLPGTYAFIDKVLGEIAAMHREAGVPLRRIHLGADELPGRAWSASPASLETIRRLGLGDRDGLWNHFYQRVDAIARRHGARVDGWEELGAVRRPHVNSNGPGSRLEPNPVFRGRGMRLFVWNNLDDSDDLAYRLANAGHDVVLAPATRLYFDMAHDAEPNEVGVNWAALTDLQQTWSYVPLDDLRARPTDPTPLPGRAALTASGRRHVLGLEGTLFSEVVREPATMQRLLLPRLLALAERAWSADPAWARSRVPADAAAGHAQDWDRFTRQVGTQVLPRLLSEQPGLAYHVPPPGLQVDGARTRSATAWPGLQVRYTTDGSEPGPDSPLAGPDGIPATTGVRAAAFGPGGQRSRTIALP
ncbi:family 20 glycosylhydrolase [Ideonella sp. 4Y16]|uniref:beta-N-acetylhexosaminidase n=1 Tax=Ideonella alba TaxID=2824118 RepID=A0A941BDS4_9BURK|nr:family 20 glycosylhydrolase [Ideonella alba]MBQ0933315.1 family 20 glycosylhydrolase [Ideonella alba]MBQ0943615.1 family 20 glycosylhydrolase [Ideonella alba]